MEPALVRASRRRVNYQKTGEEGGRVERVGRSLERDSYEVWREVRKLCRIKVSPDWFWQVAAAAGRREERRVKGV